MPTVARYGERKVDTDPLGDVRKRAAETDLSAGAGLAAAQGQSAEALGNVGGLAMHIGVQQVTAIVAEERKKADEVARLAWQNALGQAHNKLMYDPDAGALTVKGKAAMELPERVMTEFNKTAGALEAGLATEEQRQQFAHDRSQFSLQLDGELRRHVFGEMQTYRGEELQGVLSSSYETAVANALDPRRVGDSLQRGVEAITTNAPRLGLGPEAVKMQVAAFESKTHVGVINRLLANDKTAAAKIYYEEAKPQIHGDAMAAIEKAIEAGGQKAAAQSETERILALGLSPKAQILEAKKITDPDVQDQVRGRLEHEQAVADKAKRDDEEVLVDRAYNTIYKTHDVNSLDPATRAALGKHLPGLQAFANNLARGVPVVTDLGTYYSLMDAASKDPAEFATRNLRPLMATLDEGDFKHVVAVQMAIRGSKKEIDQTLAGIRTHAQIVTDTLTQYHIPTAEKDQSARQRDGIAQLRRMLDLRVEAAQAGGKKVSNEEVQQTLDTILSTSEHVPGSLWNLLVPGEHVAGYDRRVIDLQYKDVPAIERTKIEGALRRDGKPVSPQTVLDQYIEQQFTKRVRRK
jgi:hypothetical protein